MIRKTLLIGFILLGTVSAKKSFAQTLDMADPDTIHKGTYTMVGAYGTGTDLTNFTDMILVMGNDTIVGTIYSQGTTGFCDAEFNPPCTTVQGWYTLWVNNPVDGWLSLPNAVYVENDLGAEFSSIYNVKCHDDANGYLEVWVGGAMQGNEEQRGVSMSYLWSNGGTDYFIDNIPAGFYSVIITDDFTGCTDSLGITLINPPAFNLYTTQVNANCGMSDGMVWVDSVTGGIGPIMQSWVPSQSPTDTIYNLVPGMEYEVIVIDSFNCEIDRKFHITESLSFNSTFVGTTCGQASGTATINLLNGVGPFNILWSNGDTQLTADSLLPGQYTVYITDAGSCAGTGLVQIPSSDGPQITSVITGSPTCAGILNGSIDITVSGGTLPYTFAWSNGSTTEDISSINSGTYEITVTDATGCVTAQCISLADDSKLHLDWSSSFPSSCGWADGYAEAYFLGGTPPITIQWDANTGNQTGTTAIFLAPGIYQATATDNAGCTDSVIVAISEFGGPGIMVDSTYEADCGGTNGAAFITSTGTGFETYNWSDGSTNPDLLNVAAGTYYLLAYEFGCSTYTMVSVPGVPAQGQEICLVTVDSLTQSNLVAWEKPAVTDVDHYNIYRESCGNMNGFVFVGSVDYDSLSQFIDYGANPMVKSWRYVMTAVNDCGTESYSSATHKTIHIGVNRLPSNVAQLTWDDYIGFSYTEQYLWRYHNSTGWQIIDTLAASVHQYNDPSPFVLDSVEYFVEVYPGAPCVSTRATNHNSTRSNRGSIAAPNDSSIPELSTSQMMVYPNPSEGLFNLQFPVNVSGQATIRVFDLSGKLVKVIPVSVLTGINNYQLNLEGMQTGIYQVTLNLDEQILKARIVKH